MPEYAPQAWKDREQLWNAVEEVETAKDSRLAREFVVALPIELNRGEQIDLLQEFIREQFVSDGMCADAAIHDTDGHNLHAHILLTVRPLDEQGRWQYKTEKEYLCVKDGEERGFTAAEFKAVQADGWEKQYPYKVSKKKVYMIPSAAEAQGLVRADKHPKSTRYGRQNPISERWNSEEQLVLWRKAWADVTNRYLERSGHDARIDHRSHAERGLSEQPTIHEGVAARAMEKKGLISDRCELNRQIKADNALLRDLKATVRKLMQAVKNTIPAIAEAMETIRQNVIIFCYQLRSIRTGQRKLKTYISDVKSEMKQYSSLVEQIKEKSKERKSLLAEQKELPFWNIPRKKELTSRIAELSELLEELHSEKAIVLQYLQCTDESGVSAVKKGITATETELKKLDEQEEKYAAELDAALKQYADLKEQAVEHDPVELYDARQAIRHEKEQNVINRVQRAYGDKYNPLAMFDSKREVSGLLHEYADEQAVRDLKRKQHKYQKEHSQIQPKKTRDEQSR